MLFSSIIFIYLFLPVVLLFCCFFFRKSIKLQNYFLLIASLFFYAWGEPKYVFLMIASIAVNYLFGVLIDRSRERQAWGKVLLALSVVFNLSVLAVFKYLGFAGHVLSQLLGRPVYVPQIPLPIGISFFTFQAMSYVIDVYRGDASVQKNPFLVGLYISLFPQLIAGPIVRYQTVADEIRERTITLDGVLDGFARFTIGLAKKVLLANCLAVLADECFLALSEGAALSVGFSWLGAVAYLFQLFFDFSGYSDMAIGLGRMLGFHFPENFNYPFISSSITEFFSRWHISLTRWFRDYLYFPLGGSRKGKARTFFNMFVVWFLTGLWHGANYTYIVWGLLYFVLLTVERLSGLPAKKGRVITELRRGYTLLITVIGMVIFRSDSISGAWCYLKAMFHLNGNTFCDGMARGYFVQYLIPFSICILVSTPACRILYDRIKEKPVLRFVPPLLLGFLFLLSVADIVSSGYNPFIYFNF